MAAYKKLINSIFLLVVIIVTGVSNIIEPLRYIEIIAPTIIVLFLFLNHFNIQNDIVFKLLIFSLFFIFLRALVDLNFNSLFALRFLSSIIVFLAFFLLSSQHKYFTLYPVVFFLILVFLFKIGLYRYFWEYTYLFSISLFTLLYFNNFIFSLFNVLIIFFLGQRTGVLIVVYLFITFFFTFRLIQKLISIIILILLFFVFFDYLDLPYRLQVFTKLNILTYSDTFLLFLQDAPNYSYREFVNENREDIVLLARELELDASLLLRFAKWTHAIANSNSITFLFGIGPGYFGKGADSGWFRLFFEYGFLIFITISSLIYKLIKLSNSPQKTIFGIFIISNFFLDIMFSPLLVAFTGFILGLTKNRNEISYK